jgi:hypothetical protein
MPDIRAIKMTSNKAKNRCQTSVKSPYLLGFLALVRLSRPAPSTTRPSLQEIKPALVIITGISGKVNAQNGVLDGLMGCFAVVLVDSEQSQG